jgi:hypothetical protein
MVTRPKVRGSTWKLTRGCHKIEGFVDPIIISPELGPDNYLAIFLEVLELDTFGDDYRSYDVFVHSPDMADPNSWKRNHHRDFSTTSEDGMVTIHWWLVLNE